MYHHRCSPPAGIFSPEFVPSVVNLYMAKWEEEGLLCNPELILYRRFIDDLIMFRNCDIEDLRTLSSILNTNDQSINLTWEISKEKNHFLDLEISITNQNYIPKLSLKGQTEIHTSHSTAVIINHGC